MPSELAQLIAEYTDQHHFVGDIETSARSFCWQNCSNLTSEITVKTQFNSFPPDERATDLIILQSTFYFE